MSLKPQQSGTAQAILRWWERSADSGHRPHLGASLIGEPCERKLWLTFRWAKAQAWDGRMLRLFDSGQRAEARFLKELEGIGCQVWSTDDDGQQFRVSAHGGHFGGSLDSVVSGLQEAPDTPHVAEFKTSNDKLFKTLVKDGVQAAKPMHYAQMQCYMGLMNLEWALYLAENKNDASIHSERVAFDSAEFARLMAKAERVIRATEPPPKIGESAEDFACKWCHLKDLCHGDAAPEVNCRTCARSTPQLDGEAAQWTCGLPGAGVIPIAVQRTGCNRHLYIPPLLRGVGEAVDGGDEYVVYRMANGGEFTNGPPPGYASTEILAAHEKSMLADPLLKAVKEEFSTARLVASDPWADMPSDDLDAAPTKREPPATAQKRKRVAATLAGLQASDVPY